MNEQRPSKDLLTEQQIRFLLADAKFSIERGRALDSQLVSAWALEQLCEIALAHRAASEPTTSHSEDHLQRFTDLLVKEMPAGTVIGDPAWWARKLLAAACVTADEAPEPPADALEVQNALAYLRTLELACDARDDRQSVTYIGQVRALLHRLSRTSQPPADELERYRSYEHIEAQHGETGRTWAGPRYKLPVGYHEISNESGVTDEEWARRRGTVTKVPPLHSPKSWPEVEAYNAELAERRAAAEKEATHDEHCDVNDPIIKGKPCNCRNRVPVETSGGQS